MEMELNSKEPIYIQIVNFIRMKIIAGEFKEGERLLSVRDYACQLKVNPNTISRVYSELENDGLINTQRGIGKFVTEDKEAIQNLRKNYSREVIKEFIIKANSLGLTKEDVLELISEMYDSDNKEE